MTDKIDENKEVTVLQRNEKMVAHNSGEYSMYLDTAQFEQNWRVANAFARSDLVPTLYKRPENVMIALEMSMRLKLSPMMLMQNTYPIHGKIGMEAKLALALINSSGLFEGPVEFEMDGEVEKETLKCRAYATKKSNNERISGPWVTWKMVKAEGWLSKAGSKWQTMPDLMMRYRSATFFGRLVCPERLMGMQTVEELEDTPPQGEGATFVNKIKGITQDPQEPQPDPICVCNDMIEQKIDKWTCPMCGIKEIK